MNEKPKTSRQLQAEYMREQLQTIVMDMAKTKTLDEIRIKDICDQAQISLGNFYQYFDSKEAALIYSYKSKDDMWEKCGFEKIKSPVKRIQKILDTHLSAMTENSLCFDTQLYISQLKKYESYFFEEDRYLTRIVMDSVAEAQKLGEITNAYTSKEIAKRILDFDRGLVYNYCITHQEDHKAWLKYARQCQSEYLSLFLKQAS